MSRVGISYDKNSLLWIDFKITNNFRKISILENGIWTFQKWDFSKIVGDLKIDPQKRVFVVWYSYAAHFFRNCPNFLLKTKLKKWQFFFMGKTHQIRMTLPMTSIWRMSCTNQFIPKYLEFGDLVKVSAMAK